MSGLKERADARLMSTYRRQPALFLRGSGMYLYDEKGKEYLDFVAGVAVCAVGHAHPAVTEAIARQAAELVHTSNLYYTRPMVELAERLCELLGWPDGRVFFANSGAEANECAIKLVRKWARNKFGPDRYDTIAANGSFHGRTFETLAATGQPSKWENFTPLPAGFKHVAFDDPDAISEAVSSETAAVLLEPILGEGGVIVPSEGYLSKVRSICVEKGIAYIADEVQTGLGRTGNWFAFQAEDAVPDVITLAKALGNGLPIGACIARAEFAETFGPGDHGSTMGGGALVSAAALTVLDIIESEGLVHQAERVGKYLMGHLKNLQNSHPLITEVRGKGLLQAIQLRADQSRAVVDVARSEGLLVNDVTPSAIRMCPPLIVTEKHCDRAVEILEAALGAVEKEVA